MTALTKRDEGLLRVLAAYELLSTRQVLGLVFAGIRKTTVLRRLRKLEAERFIRRTAGLAGGEFVWSLGAAGAFRLRLEKYLENLNRNTLEHDVALNDVRLAFEQAGLALSWVTEQALRRRVGEHSFVGESLNPDAIAAVRTGGGQEAVAVELELWSKSPARYRKIFSHYGSLSRIWAVWYVVPDPALGKKILREWVGVNENRRRPEFYWLLLDEIRNLGSPIRLHGAWGDRVIHRPHAPPAHPPAHAVSRDDTVFAGHFEGS